MYSKYLKILLDYFKPGTCQLQKTAPIQLVLYSLDKYSIHFMILDDLKGVDFFVWCYRAEIMNIEYPRKYICLHI